MRELDFRGYALKDKREVKGYAFYSMADNSHMILEYVYCGGNSFDEPPSDHQEAVEVDPNTIGQYINKNYEDGTQMFEGDKVECFQEEQTSSNAYDDIFTTKSVTGVIAFQDGQIGVLSDGVFLCNALHGAATVKKTGTIHDTPTND